MLIQPVSRDMFSCACAAEISPEGTSRTLEPVSDKKMYIQLNFFISYASLLLKHSLTESSVFPGKDHRREMESSSFFQEGKVSVKKLKQQSGTELWEKQA